jgi:acyl dehydratase
MTAVLVASRSITSEDIDACGRLTGDMGSHHVTGLNGRQMAHGILTLSAVPLLDSPGVRVREWSFTFLSPVFAGQTVTATLEVTRTEQLPGALVRLFCQVSVVNDDGTPVVAGSCIADLSRERARAELADTTEGN